MSLQAHPCGCREQMRPWMVLAMDLWGLLTGLLDSHTGTPTQGATPLIQNQLFCFVQVENMDTARAHYLALTSGILAAPSLMWGAV